MIIGNINAEIQMYKSEKNEIGELVKTWETVQTVKGFLDLRSGDSDYRTFDAKIEDSTHIFLCDYIPLAEGVTAENSRMLIKGKTYDIMLIDNPMELCQHYEIYLKYIGGQPGGSGRTYRA
ncbi:MAG: head-tail adaptor protein [Ruminiclostridium sp.]|nr:head-tail adaptor protein [Ruminiclostridium sp.]MBQ8434573.1 head-tail adaptor protein [Oscillospiraceae bacterium]